MPIIELLWNVLIVIIFLIFCLFILKLLTLVLNRRIVEDLLVEILLILILCLREYLKFNDYQNSRQIERRRPFYYVVSFKSYPGVKRILACIPKSWVVESNGDFLVPFVSLPCPNYELKILKDKIKNSEMPDTSWKRYPVEVIHESSVYNEALEVLNLHKYENSSGVQESMTPCTSTQNILSTPTHHRHRKDEA